MKKTSKTIGRIALSTLLVTAGIAHLSFKRKAFKAQVPDWVPLKKDDTVVYSGIAEILLGSALITVHEKQQPNVGKITALFFVAVFPGNVAQYIHKKDSFGLNTDKKRLARLFFQPLLIALAIKCTKK